MASITKRFRAKKGAKVLEGWNVRTSKLSINEVTFYCPVSRYDESAVIRRREIIDAIEKACDKGKAASSEIIAEIQALNDENFTEWLVKYGILEPVKVLSFDGLLDMALEGIADQGTKQQTISRIRIGCRYFSEYLNEKGLEIPVASIDKKLARDFWAWMKAKSAAQKWAPSTINRYLTNLKQVFRWGVNHLDEMQGNPFDCLDKIVDTREKPKDYLSDDQAAQVLNALERSDKSKLWTALFLLGYRQGLRVWSEAPRLKWGFVDFEGRRLMIVDVKRSKRGGKKTREMILDDQTAEALRNLRDYRLENGETNREQDFIFPELVGKPQSTIINSFKTALRKVGVKTVVSVGTMRRAASNYWGELVGEYNENVFLGHSKEVARTHYRSEGVTQNALDMYDNNRNAVEAH